MGLEWGWKYVLTGVFMKNRIALLFAACLWLALPLAAQQTLADRARELRQQKRTPSANEKVLTNDSLMLRSAPSISEKPADSKTDTAKKADAEEAGEDEKSADEKKTAAAAGLRSDIERAKNEVATLQRELDIANRENKLRIAQFYSDAGNRLRDEKRFVDDQNKTLADIADKQKRLGETNATLERLRNEARRAGIPPGMIP
jgi:hypothetical protein